MPGLEYDAMCEHCKGTGLYSGMAEGPGAAVVCKVCGGEGSVHRIVKWELPPKEKIRRADIERVYQTNPGIGIGKTEDLSLDDFGGMPYDDWYAGKPFPPRSEMRRFTCPKWWLQSCGENRDLPFCDLSFCDFVTGGLFPRCRRFKKKADCWKKYDDMEAK